MLQTCGKHASNTLARPCNLPGSPHMIKLCAQGVIGEGYDRLMNPKTVPEEDDYKFHGERPTASSM